MSVTLGGGGWVVAVEEDLMRIGLFLPSVSPLATPEFLEACGTAAQEAGIASVWVGEHVVFTDDLTGYVLERTHFRFWPDNSRSYVEYPDFVARRETGVRVSITEDLVSVFLTGRPAEFGGFVPPPR